MKDSAIAAKNALTDVGAAITPIPYASYA